MFEYFGGHYAWDLGVLMALQLGGEMSEIDAACRPLRERLTAGAGDARSEAELQVAWLESWTALADRLAEKGSADEMAGHRYSASRKYRRSCVYYQQADRMGPLGDPRKDHAYRAMLKTFRKSVTLGREGVEWVEVPYEGTSLPSLFVAPRGPGPWPCMIGFDGFDVTKEWTYLCGLAPELARRGVAMLIVDHPGVGLALREKGLPAVVDTERPAGACVDYLAARGDVTSGIGILGMSLGGYFAPRAAAFEPRLRACVAWGARWDNEGSHGRMLKDPALARSIPGWFEHALKVYGAPDIEACRRIVRQMTLEGIAGRISCPILVVHGENDRQVAVEQARKTIAGACNSPRRDLRVFTAEEGGAEHVNGDNFALAIDVIADWCADVLVEA